MNIAQAAQRGDDTLAVANSAEAKDAARRVLEEIFPADDEAALAEYVSAACINHDGPPGTPQGLAGIAGSMHMLAAAFSDQKWVVHLAVAEGDLVALHCTHSGTHTGNFFGLPGTGRRFSYEQMHILRFENLQTTEHWAVRDQAALMRQLTG